MATKIFNFLGVDHKVGTTMIVQSIADILSSKGYDRNVLVLHLDGNEGADYIMLPGNSASMDNVFQPLMQHLAHISELDALLVKDGNLSTLCGARSNDCAVRYTPEITQDIVNLLKDSFDFVLIDSGASAHYNGLSIGAFEYDCPNILITTQQDSAYKSFMRKSHDVYMKLSNSLDAVLINKYQFSSGRLLMTDKEIWDRYGFTEGYSVRMADASWQAEIDNKSLIEYDKGFKKDIESFIQQVIL